MTGTSDDQGGRHDVKCHPLAYLLVLYLLNLGAYMDLDLHVFNYEKLFSVNIY